MQCTGIYAYPLHENSQLESATSANECKAAGETCCLAYGEHEDLQFKPNLMLFTEQSSEKSSQERLSQLDPRGGLEKDETEWGPANAPVSSKLSLDTLPPAESAQHPTRASTRRVRLKVPTSTDLSDESSPREGSIATDSDWRREGGRLQEASSCKTSALRILEQITGATSEEKAASARLLGEEALQDAEIKAKRATKLIAVAQRMATEASRAAKRRRVTHAITQKFGSCENVLVGTRIAVYWADDKAFYRGRVVDANEDEFLHKLVYDDDISEWISLADERFRLLTPRAVSAGCSLQLVRELESLDAEALASSKRACSSNSAARGCRPSKEQALGWCIALTCRADGCSYEAQVLAYNPVNGLHHVLYRDGEDEWLCLADEQIEMLKYHRSTLPAGLPLGQAAPTGKQAIGWRVAVYWKTDQSFYPGVIQGFDSATGRHHIVYSDGDEEHLNLSNECLKWLLPPPNVAVKAAQAAQERMLDSLAEPLHGILLAAGKSWKGRQLGSRSAQLGAGKHARPCSRASRARGGGGQGVPLQTAGSTESISAMLDRVDSDERALMSDIAPTVPFSFGLPELVVPSHAGSSPLADSLEGGGSTLPTSPTGLTTISPAQTSGMLQLEPFADATPQSPSQAIRASSRASTWQMGPPLSESKFPLQGSLRSRHLTKSEPDLQRSVDLDNLESGPHGLLASINRASSLPTAPPPSPLPQLDAAILPGDFSNSALLLAEDHGNGNVQHELGSSVVASDHVEMGSDFLDILMDIPPIDSGASVWWR